MFDLPVEFDAAPVCASVAALRRTTLHRHPNAIELAYVFTGELHVTVSCESFDLRPGDYVVINRGDPHQLSGSDDNVTALVHLDPTAFRDVDPDVEHLVFACESFDLARHRGQEAALRGLILELVDGVVFGAGGRADRADELVELLCSGYSLEHYYNRAASLSGAQQDRFRAMLRFLREHATERDVLASLASAHHYSKSYVSHYFKEASGIGLRDLLGYFRVAAAEQLLLSTDATMLELSTRCGFSDVKYFTRTFVDWFHQSPADYRRRHQPETRRADDVRSVPDSDARDLLQRHRQRVASPAADGPRLSVTPLLLKNLGSRLDLFTATGDYDEPSRPTAPAPTVSGAMHLVPVRVTRQDVEDGFLVEGLTSFRQVDAHPCLVLEYVSTRATLELLADVLSRLSGDTAARPPIWLTYTTFHDRGGVDEVVATAQREHGVDVQPIMTP